MNTKFLLAGILSVVLFSGLGMQPQPAYALDIIIDDFNTENSDPGCDSLPLAVNMGIPAFAGSDTGGNVAPRICTATWNAVVAGGGTGGISVVQGPPDQFLHFEDGVTDITSMLTYGGPAGAQLNLDLSNHVSIDLDLTFGTDAMSDVILELTSDIDGAVMVDTMSLFTPVGPAMLSFDLASFAVDLNDVDKIKFTFDSASMVVASDINIDNIIAIMAVGGEFIGVDTSALLLAGAEMNSYWILPLIAAIGVGAFIISRKRN